jgi:hypothetical protein
MFAVQMDQCANWDRLQDAQVLEQVMEEVGQDQRIHPLTPWSVEHGHLP